MSGIPVKNHGKKPQGFLKEAETCVKLHGNKMKNIPCQL